jgi:hypothetical protein
MLAVHGITFESINRGGGKHASVVPDLRTGFFA